MITLLTVNPASVGTPEQTPATTFGSSDWLEIRNDTPYLCIASILGTNGTSFMLTPFEHNGIPVSQLVQNASLKYNQIVVVLNFYHYYSSVAIENSSPTNICTVNQLSQQEAQTNTYPIYTARMNTTVSTIANILQNVGSSPGTVIAFVQPTGDSNAQGTFSLNDSAVMTLGDNAYNGQFGVFDTSGDETQLSGSGVFMSNGVLSGDVPAITHNGDTSGSVTLYMLGQMLGFKVFVVVFNNYNNSGYTTINLPATISFGFFACGNIGSGNRLQLLNSGVAQNVSIITALGTGSASGTSQGSSSIFGNSIGQLPGSLVNQFGINNVATAITEVFVMIGA